MSKNSKKSKKKDLADKSLLHESVTPPPASSVIPNQTVEKLTENKSKDVQKENDPTGNEKSKKKKKKKKKTPSESTCSLTEGEADNPASDLNMCKDMEESLAKLSELTVIRLPTPPPEKNEQQSVATNSSNVESSKKKKKKNKQKNNSAQENTNKELDAPVKSNSNLAHPTAQDSTSASYFKVERARDSPVLIVSNPSDKSSSNDKLYDSKTETNCRTNITMGPGSNCLIKNNDHMLFPSLLQGMFSQFQPAQPPFVSLVPTQGNICSTSDQAGNLVPNVAESPAEAPQKTKAQLKAERRAVQEAQRAAKEANKKAAGIINNHQLLNKTTATPKQTTIKNTSHMASKEVKKTFFSHLPQYKSSSSLEKHLQSDDFVHPAVIAVGAKYAKSNLMDSNGCCIDILLALKNVIKDYKTPANKELRRDLGFKVEKLIAFLQNCRPLSVGILNAMKFLKLQICNAQENLADDNAKIDLCDQIEKYILDSIHLAVEAISKFVSSEIKNGDVILTYAYSSVVKNALIEAHKQNKVFKVIIIDSRPTLEGKEILNYLLKHNIECSYALTSALTYVMKDVTKVIVGAHAVGASGYVMSRIGTSQIALLASSSNIPFLVCCESYKFCERAFIDSFVDNELGDPESLVKLNNFQPCVLENWKDLPQLDLVNLLYDVTPPCLISKIITEKSLLI